MDCHRKDFEIAEELGDKGGVGRAHGNMGNIYYSIGRYQSKWFRDAPARAYLM